MEKQAVYCGWNCYTKYTDIQIYASNLFNEIPQLFSNLLDINCVLEIKKKYMYRDEKMYRFISSTPQPADVFLINKAKGMSSVAVCIKDIFKNSSILIRNFPYKA
jgi:hypothetical protein